MPTDRHSMQNIYYLRIDLDINAYTFLLLIPRLLKFEGLDSIASGDSLDMMNMLVHRVTRHTSRCAILTLLLNPSYRLKGSFHSY